MKLIARGCSEAVKYFISKVGKDFPFLRFFSFFISNELNVRTTKDYGITENIVMKPRMLISK